jgi:hypothetical protein
MESTIVNLITQIVAGAVGGNGAAASLKDYSLGTLGNTVAGGLVVLASGKFCRLSFRSWPAAPEAASMPVPWLGNWSEAGSAVPY